MRKMMTALAAFTLAVGMTACSKTDDTSAEASTASGIAGDWKVDLDSAQFENDTRDYVLADGKFQCNSCTPPYSVSANGEWQEVDRPGMDGQMMEVVDERTVKSSSRLGDKEMGGATWTVSEDGKTLKVAFNDLSGEEPVSGSQSFTRTEDGPAGSHAMSGKWTTSGMDSLDDAGLRITYGLDGDTFTANGNGSSYSATLGGEAVAIEGDEAGTMVAVERTGDNSFKQTYSRDGETVTTMELTVDGDTLNGVSTDVRDGSVVRWSATRQ